MTSLVRRYGFINAKLRARLTKLVDEHLIEQIIDAPTLDDALIFLRNTPFSAIESLYTRSGDLKAGELELFKQEINLYRDLEKYLEGEVLDMIRALSLYGEIENVKNALRLFFDHTYRGRDIEEAALFLYPHRIEHDIDAVRLAHAKNMDEAVGVLAESPYGEVLDQHRESVETGQSLFQVEIALDQYYFRNLIEKAGKLHRRDRRIALRIVGIEIDLLNINWVVRFRNFYRLPQETVLGLAIPHGHTIDQDALRDVYASENVTRILQGIITKKYPSLAVFLSSGASDTNSRILLIEQVLDHILMLEVRRILSGYPFSIGIILAYFILKRRDIRRIGTVLHAKQYNLKKERIKDIL
jgi:V/A-type H+-transporting ATPase subunit C